MLTEKLMRIQTEIKAPKNLYNKFGKFYYRNAEGICEVVKPFLLKEKCMLTLTDSIESVSGKTYVKAVASLKDCESEECLQVTAYAREADLKKGMDEAQITGATSSYARKYALNGMFLLDDTKDPDTDEYKEEQEEREQEEQDRKKTEEVAAKKISQTKVAALEETFLNHNIDPKKVCELYKVENLNELTERKHSNIIQHIKDLEKQCKL